MAGVSEKQVPKYLSYGAIIASVIICGALWVAGSNDPRAFTSSMEINHHSSYGGSVECYACHVPQGSAQGMKTRIGCLTSGCHGELEKKLSYAEAVALFSKNEAIQEVPEPMRTSRIENHIKNHASYNKWSCMECHTEHTNNKTVVPKNWVSVLKTES